MTPALDVASHFGGEPRLWVTHISNRGSPMDTRRIPGSQPTSSPAEIGTETVPVNLVELVELRYVVTARGRTGLGSIIPAIVLFGVLATIATLAIATSNGWSILTGS